MKQEFTILNQLDREIKYLKLSKYLILIHFSVIFNNLIFFLFNIIQRISIITVELITENNFRQICLALRTTYNLIKPFIQSTVVICYCTLAISYAPQQAASMAVRLNNTCALLLIIIKNVIKRTINVQHMFLYALQCCVRRNISCFVYN